MTDDDAGEGGAAHSSTRGRQQLLVGSRTADWGPTRNRRGRRRPVRCRGAPVTVVVAAVTGSIRESPTTFALGSYEGPGVDNGESFGNRRRMSDCSNGSAPVGAVAGCPRSGLLRPSSRSECVDRRSSRFVERRSDRSLGPGGGLGAVEDVDAAVEQGVAQAIGQLVLSVAPRVLAGVDGRLDEGGRHCGALRAAHECR